ncbi:MAG TPA: zf-HC2 domain-containing protein, partial [Candidatus Binatia bacterium]|nr:zf-HC2 domain-containing protein [Candidatus Binatia bacterium]
MECYSEQIVSIFVDGELGPEEAQRLREHVATCRRCRQLMDALRAENRALRESLQELAEEAVMPAEFAPARRWRAWRDVALVGAVLALSGIASVWINEVNIPQALEWLNPFTVSGRTNLLFELSSYLTQGGAAMLRDYAAGVGGLLLLLLLALSALLLGRRWRLRQPGLGLLMVLLVLSLPGSALERRHSEFVTVTANETVNDTLLAAGNIVRVDGVVNGDLLAFGQSVEVRGTIKGDL